jgi:hypothetical protein
MNKGIVLQYPTVHKNKIVDLVLPISNMGAFFFYISPQCIHFKSLAKDLAITQPEHSVF